MFLLICCNEVANFRSVAVCDMVIIKFKLFTWTLKLKYFFCILYITLKIIIVNYSNDGAESPKKLASEGVFFYLTNMYYF